MASYPSKDYSLGTLQAILPRTRYSWIATIVLYSRQSETTKGTLVAEGYLKRLIANKPWLSPDKEGQVMGQVR